MTLKLAVIGDPVAHSKSPALQRGFLAACGRDGTYEAIRVAAGSAGARIDALRAAGYHGLNVTTPLKEEAFARAETHDRAASASGAVNTLILALQIEGYNTDGAGALGALGAAGLSDVRGRRILILGAGATARAATIALTTAGAAVYLWNRTALRAAEFALRVGVALWTTDVRPEAFLSTLPPEAVPGDAALLTALRAVPLAVDANYGSRATLGAMLGRGDVHDGSAMLRASARASFEIFMRAVP